MTNPRKRADSDGQFIEIIDEITRRDGLHPEGTFGRVVLEEYITSFYERRLKEIASLSKRRPSPADIEAARKHCSTLTAKRWPDTGSRLRGAMIIFATDGDPSLRRSFTLWIDPQYVDQARKTKKPLANIIRDRLSERLRRLLGTQQFGFWFHIERTRADPYDLHIHGVITLQDESHFTDLKKRKKLRREIIAAGGREFKRTGARVLDMRKANLNIGWIAYSRKQRPLHRLKPISHRVLPPDIGQPLEAWSGTLKRDVTDFYEKARTVYNAIITGRIWDWDDETWDEYCHPFFF